MAAQKDTLAQTGTPKSSTPPLPPPSNRLLIAASGTGGHLFPALAVTQDLTDFQVEWLGVNNRLETHLVPAQYPLHTVPIEGFQQGLSPKTLMVLAKFLISILQTRRLLKQGQFQGVFTTGGYIAAPAIIAARSLGLPSILHESNALPGKVTRWLSRWCSTVALGFEAAVQHLPQANTVVVGTPVRKSFLQPQALDLPIPKEVPLIVVVGGSQGALAVNRLVRQCASTWLAENAWLVHLTGDHDRDVASFQHPHYFPLPFYDNMAALLQRADLAISRAGAGTLTELTITATPALLIPYPYAAEDHQTYNAAVLGNAGAAYVFQQSQLTPELLKTTVLDLLRSPQKLEQMSRQAHRASISDSTEKLSQLIRASIPLG